MFSVTVLIEMTKRNVVGKGLLHFTDDCELWREVREGIQDRQTLEQRSFFRLDLGIHYLSYSAPVHLPRNGAAQSWLGLPISISPTDVPTGQCDGVNPPTEDPSDVSAMCQVDSGI